jgi:protein tyrosine/serine phosphatase
MQKRIFRRWAIVILCILTIPLVYWINHENLHTLSQGKAYRSAQLSSSELTQLIQQDHLQSVINLRGENPGKMWYDHELNTVNQYHLSYYPIRISAHQLPSPEALQALIFSLQQAPQPLLIHCASGVDRTGFASAIFLILNNQPLTVAEAQFSWRYYAISSDSIGKLVFAQYNAWLKKTHQQHSKAVFLHWAKVEYHKP